MTSRNFNQAARNLERSKQQRFPLIPGFLGFLVNGVETVEVPTRPGYVFVRLRGAVSEVIHAFNDEVSPVYGLPVLVTRDDVDNTRYKVISRDTGVYINWGSASSYLPRHGDSHSFSSRAGTGGDVVWVYGRQMMPLNVIPSGTNAAGSVKIEEGVYYQAGAWHSSGGTGTVSFLPAKPSAGNARMMLLYLDEYGNPGIATGTVFSESISGTSSLIPYLPTLSNNYYVPLAGIRLTSSTNTITWNDITDLRPWIVGDGFIPTGTFAPNSAGYITVGSEAGLTAERTLTAGAGISITDNGANNTIVISATNTGTSTGGGGGSYPLIYDNMLFKATGTAISFRGDLDVEVIAGLPYVDVSTGVFSRVGHSHDQQLLVYDSGIFKGTGTSIDFDGGLEVISSGTSMFVNALGGGGGSGNNVIYDDSIFKVTGSIVSYDERLSVSISGSYTYINVDEFYQTISVAKSGTRYSSIQAAINSISDASITKRYLVDIKPGIYIEKNILMKPYVTVRGSGQGVKNSIFSGLLGTAFGSLAAGLSETWIYSSGTSSKCFIMDDFSRIENLSMYNATEIAGKGVDGNNSNNWGLKDVSILSETGILISGSSSYRIDLSNVNIECGYNAGQYGLYVRNLPTTAQNSLFIDHLRIVMPGSSASYAMNIQDSDEIKIIDAYCSHPGMSISDDLVYIDGSNVEIVNSEFIGGRFDVDTTSTIDFHNVKMSRFVNTSGNSITGNYFIFETDTQKYDGIRIDSKYLRITEQGSELPAPASGYGYLYCKSDGKAYFQNDAGTVFDLTASGGGGSASPTPIYDDGVFKVTGTAISFDSNLSVAVTGTTAFVSSSSSNIPIFNDWNYRSTNRSTSAYAFKGNYYTPSRSIKLYALGYWGTVVASASYKSMVIIGTSNIESIVGTSETITMSGSLPDTSPRTIWLRFDPALTLSSGTKYGFIYGRTSNTGTYVLPVPFNENWTSPFDSDDGIGEGIRLESDSPASGTAISGVANNASMGFQWSYI